MKKISVLSSLIFLATSIFFSPGIASAAPTSCPETWNLSSSKFPVADTDQIFTYQMTIGRGMSSQLMSVAYTLDGKTFRTINLNQRVPSVLDATPVSLAVDRSLSILVSGKPIKATYAFRVAGCSQITNFSIPGSFQTLKTTKTNFPDYLKTVKSYTDGLNQGGLPEVKLFATPKSVTAAATELTNCQKNIVKAVQTPASKGSALSQKFSDVCPMAGGKWSEIRILQEGADCLIRQDDSGPTNFYSVKLGSTCKVAIARLLGDDPNTTKVLGPKVAYIFSEFSLTGKWAASKSAPAKAPATKVKAKAPAKTTNKVVKKK
jgi:hypothetical protein